MTEPVISLERIEREARAAEATYQDINDACPYPFYSEAGRVFKKAFVAARVARNMPALKAALKARPVGEERGR